jgi:lysyl-tRNA synthetase class 2
MKRLVAAGYEKIFQICRVWREGERGSQHTPEFTLLEWYRSGSGYRNLMEECEAMIPSVASSTGPGETVSFRGHTLHLSSPWERISVRDAFQRYARVSMEKALEGELFDELMAREIEPRLGMERPSFLYDYPAERGALARLKDGDPDLAERFELYIGGVEIANAFSELVDGEEQRRRFVAEQTLRRNLMKQVYPMPEKFLEELGGMGPCAGIALGVDRLVMVLLDASRIDDVVAFTPEEL